MNLRFPFRRRRKPVKIKKLRLALILLGLSLLAFVSTVFGMMMAVASDLPQLENREQFRNEKNSVLLDIHGRRLGILTGNQNVILVPFPKISKNMVNAIVSIEDRRFWTNSGVDIRGIGRAFWADVTNKSAVQGASTITQQFVKNALAAQRNRTVFEKLREAAIAYHLTRKWSKQKILTEYLNSSYFGNGAYGIESAARTYFGKSHPGCDTNATCAADLTVPEAALLAGMVASPTAYDPIAHPYAAVARRNVVLRAMLDQRYITQREYAQDSGESLPTQADMTPPAEHSIQPYFTSWVRQQAVNAFGATKAFTGGLKIYTTLDYPLQQAAERAVNAWLPPSPGLPSAALVAIDNKTGEVRAMVGGNDYEKEPFNLASQGQRQPGSSFKPFTLAVALKEGVSLNSVWPSEKRVFKVPHSKHEFFVVNNYEGDYTGSNTLAGAMTVSDNSIYAAVGIHVGTRRIAHLAERMGIRTPVSHNYAMTLGGLHEGVTPLDMAHAYETFATGGQLVTDPQLGTTRDGPVGIHKVLSDKGHVIRENKPQRIRVLSPQIAQQVTGVLETVVQSGTGKEAQIPGFAAGKTGTTENYGDAWFVGWNDRLTVAVWVGFPHSVKSMKTLFRGSPVAGGTYPALIWKQFMLTAEALYKQRSDNQKQGDTTTTPDTSTVPTPSYTAPSTTSTAPATTTPSTKSKSSTPKTDNAPATPNPNPTPTQPPTGGGTGGAGGAAPPPSGQ
jgi:penicillin-binding protein 1A